LGVQPFGKCEVISFVGFELLFHSIYFIIHERCLRANFWYHSTTI
jgi:hypothetical protein